MGFIHQMHVVSALIGARGLDATLFREKKNEFQEPGEHERIGVCKGLFHESNGYLGINIADSGKIHTAKQPMFLVSYTDTVKKQDILEIAGQTFRVTGLDDLGNLHLFLDISLEVA